MLRSLVIFAAAAMAEAYLCTSPVMLGGKPAGALAARRGALPAVRPAGRLALRSGAIKVEGGKSGTLSRMRRAVDSPSSSELTSRSLVVAVQTKKSAKALPPRARLAMSTCRPPRCRPARSKRMELSISHRKQSLKSPHFESLAVRTRWCCV